MVRRFVLALALVLTLMPAVSVRAVVVQDDFRSYADGNDGSARWDAGWGGWSMRGGTYESDGHGQSMAVYRQAPYGRHLVVEATVTPRMAVDAQWKTAGVAVVLSDGDYWHLALVESPSALGAHHTAEMAEMVGGRWLAHSEGPTRLTSQTETGSMQWAYDRPYQFRLEIDEEGITGTIRAADGSEVLTRRMLFTAPGVRSGKPALTTGSLAAGFADFRAEITLKAPGPKSRAFPAYRRTGRPVFTRKATGFFRVEKVGGKWWMIDPSGAAFYAVGTDHANYNVHHCEKLGYAPYARNVAALYGSEVKWAASTAARLREWGFNTLGAGCGESVRYRGLAHTAFLSLGTDFTSVSDIAQRTTWTGFPDVFHPRFKAYCEYQARRKCAPLRTDPWLIGYFLDNELEWFGKNGSDGGLVDETMRKPADHPAKRALVAFLRKRYPSIDSLNRAWGVHLVSFDELASTTTPIGTSTAAGLRDRLDFVRLIADRYFSITCAAIRKADPNHMVLGCRFAGYAPNVWAEAGKYLDIVSVNFYGQVDLARGVTTDMPRMFAGYYARARRPLMITEWSFPALDAGLPSQHGAGQRVPTQKDKARAISVYQRKLFSMSYMVGSDYFMWVDEPALGVSSTFPEDSNYGMVNEHDEPWSDVTQTFVRINPYAVALHAGRVPALSAGISEPVPGTALIRVRNAGSVAARCPLVIWVQGIRAQRTVIVPGRGTADVRIKVRGVAYVAIRLDPQELLLQADESGCSAERLVGLASVRKPAVIVTNPTDSALTNAPVVVRNAMSLAGLHPVDASGASLEAQLDRLPSGAELAVRVPSIGAHSVTVLRFAKGPTQESVHTVTGDGAVDLAGDFRLEHETGGHNLFDRVSLGGVLLGRFNTLVHQVGREKLWTTPEKVEEIVSWAGPVRTLLEVTSVQSRVASGSGAPGFRMRTRVARWGSEDWFSVRVLSVTNMDQEPWRFSSYYIYPVSSIAGRAEDDHPLVVGDAPLWFDAQAGLGYGAIVDLRTMHASFWKDTADGAGEHADISRDIERDLKPGETATIPASDPDTLVFGARGTAGNPGGETVARLRALSRIRATAAR